MKLPSVTQILSPYIDKTWFDDESRDRGSAVHGACACHLLGLWYLPLKKRWQPYFDSFKKWADLAIDKIVLVEERLEDINLGFVGKPDLICVIRGDTCNSLPDIKTSQAYFQIWRLQTAAYRHLAKVAKGIHTHRAFSVRTKNDSSGCLTTPEYPRDYSSDFNLFLGCLNMWKFMNT